MKPLVMLVAAMLVPSAVHAQVTTSVTGKQQPYVVVSATLESSKPVPLAEVWPRADAVVYLRIVRTLPAKPQPGGQLCTEHEVAIVEILKAHPVEGPTVAQPFFILQESAGEFEGLKGHAPYPEGTDLVAFLTWRPAYKRFALWFGENIAVQDGRVVSLRPGGIVRQQADPLFADVPAGTPIEDFLVKLRALAKEQR